MRDDRTVWEKLAAGDVSTTAVCEAYADNLRLVLPSARRLADELPGKTVITSDHGNGFGEFSLAYLSRIFGHPRGVYVPQLVKVPWVEIESDESKTVTEAERSVDSDGTDEDMINERLRNLGYK
jgi:hypothetical protein